MKKQFRLYDIYRTAATGEMSNIRGIKIYSVDSTATHIHIMFVDGQCVSETCEIENYRKALVKKVNKMLRALRRS